MAGVGVPVGGPPLRSCPGPAFMTPLDSQRMLVCVAGVAVSAALLWLGAEMFATARTRPGRSGRGLFAAALAIVGAGLWFPGHFFEPGDAAAAPVGISLAAAAFAVGLAGLAGATAFAATRKTLPAFAAFSVLTLMVAYAHSVFATPGLFRAGAAVGAWGPGLA